MKRDTGFTLIELLMTVALIAILLGVGIPSFQSMMQQNRVVSVTNHLVSALQTARSEAIKRGTDLTVCRRNTAGDACDAGTDWSVGWLIHDGSNAIKVWDSPGAGMAVGGPNAGITYRSTGFAQSAQNVTLQPPGCGAGDEHRRTVAVSQSGLVTTTSGTCQ